MYKEQLSINPAEIFVSLNFDNVKKEIKAKFSNLEDLGSVILTKTKNYALSINNIGKVVILYNYLSESELEELINFIEHSFKISIDSFAFDKKPLLN